MPISARKQLFAYPSVPAGVVNNPDYRVRVIPT